MEVSWRRGGLTGDSVVHLTRDLKFLVAKGSWGLSRSGPPCALVAEAFLWS